MEKDLSSDKFQVSENIYILSQVFYSLLNKLEIVRLQMCLVTEIFQFTAVSRLLLAFKPVIAVLCVTRMFAESRQGFLHGRGGYYSYVLKNVTFLTFAFLELTVKLHFGYIRIILSNNKYPRPIKCSVADSTHAILKHCSLNPNL